MAGATAPVVRAARATPESPEARRPSWIRTSITAISAASRSASSRAASARSRSSSGAGPSAVARAADPLRSSSSSTASSCAAPEQPLQLGAALAARLQRLDPLGAPLQLHARGGHAIPGLARGEQHEQEVGPTGGTASSSCQARGGISRPRGTRRTRRTGRGRRGATRPGLSRRSAPPARPRA